MIDSISGGEVQDGKEAGKAEFLEALAVKLRRLEPRGYGKPFAASFALLCLLIASQVFVGKVVYEAYSQDLFVVLDGIRHLQYGQRIHEDFSSLVGIFYFLPYYVTTFFKPLSGMTIIYGNALVALISFGLAAVVSRNRLSPVWAAIFSFYVGLLSVSPRLLSANIEVLNYENNAFYNRYSWSLICIVCLLLALPRNGSDRKIGQNTDAILCGVLLFLLFYLKATYFLVGLGFLGLATITIQRSNVMTAAIALATLAGALVLMELATGITAPYLRDLAKGLSAARPGRLKEATDIFISTYNTDILVLSIGGASAILGGKLKGVLPKAIFIFSLLGGGLALAAYNHGAYEIPVEPVATLVALLMFLPWQVDADPSSLWYLLLTSVVALIFLRPIAADVDGLLRAERWALAPGSGVSSLRGTPVSDLAISQKQNGLLPGAAIPPSTCCVENDTEYYYWVSDGMTLLKRHIRPGETVLPFAWADPFSLLLNLPPIRHVPLWWDQYRTFSATSSPDPSKLFADVNYVLIPKIDMPWAPFQLMSQIYADELRTKFRQVDQSRFWTLLEKQIR